ncbi:DUF4249 domain-containing protein [bacterium]|nr:DUF4249 domain-containing protein [bacterium]
MKKLLLVLLINLIFFSCEDVVEISLNDSKEILIVDAYINWIKETNKTEQKVNLSLSSPYFEKTYQPATGASVYIEDEYGKIYHFTEEKSGNYIPIDTIPYDTENSYTINIEYKNQTFTGKESLRTVSSINRIEQESVELFGNEAVQLEAYCFDPIDENNYSYFEFSSTELDFPEYNIFRDDFSSGGEYYGFLLDSELKKGDRVKIRQFGLSNFGYNYWYLLILQNTQQGGPFVGTPVNLKGNIVNLKNTNENTFGYFRMSEVSEIVYVIR